MLTGAFVPVSWTTYSHDPIAIYKFKKETIPSFYAIEDRDEHN